MKQHKTHKPSYVYYLGLDLSTCVKVMDKIYLLLHSGSAHSLSSDILARQRFKEANNITNN